MHSQPLYDICQVMLVCANAMGHKIDNISIHGQKHCFHIYIISLNNIMTKIIKESYAFNQDNADM